MRVPHFTIIFFIVSIISPDEAYRILGIFPFNSKSHSIMFKQLMKGLAKRSHDVDVVSHFPLTTPFPNYNDIINLAENQRIVALENNVTYEFVKSQLKNSASLAFFFVTKVGGDLCDFMDLPQFKEIIKNPPKDPPYDIIIIELFSSPCYLALSPHLKVPVVGVRTSIMLPWMHDLFGNPEELAYIPHFFSGLVGKMNFWQRIKNIVTGLKAKWTFNYYRLSQGDQIKKYIGPNAPSLQEAEKSLSLLLINTHHSLHGAKPHTTAIVEVGGLHIPEVEEPLPNDLQQWTDDSKDGFVYVSFGSMVKIESFPKETLDVLYASLAKLAPIRVLMKIAKPEELPPGLPSNVITRPWISQLGVLKHKHARAFMTHGGLMGTQESIYCGVPMIGVPIFSDQVQNVNIYVQKNVAVALDPDQLTEKKLDTAFKAVLHDPSYMEAAKKLSAEFRDRPMPPLDTAVFWVEYVVRHGGTILRSPAMDLTWWQKELLDVYAALLFSAALTVYLMILLTKKIITVVLKSDIKNVKYYKKKN